MARRWIRDRCVHCSLCTALCPEGAFKLNGDQVEYFPELCVDCDECLVALGCPRRAVR